MKDLEFEINHNGQSVSVHVEEGIVFIVDSENPNIKTNMGLNFEAHDRDEAEDFARYMLKKKDENNE